MCTQRAIALWCSRWRPQAMHNQVGWFLPRPVEGEDASFPFSSQGRGNKPLGPPDSCPPHLALLVDAVELVSNEWLPRREQTHPWPRQIVAVTSGHLTRELWCGSSSRCFKPSLRQLFTGAGAGRLGVYMPRRGQSSGVSSLKAPPGCLLTATILLL